MTLFCLFFFSIVGNLMGQQQNRVSEDIQWSLEHVQQSGNFYFLPLSGHGPYSSSTHCNTKLAQYTPEAIASDVQIILSILSQFEEKRKVDVLTHEVIRDQRARDACATVYGILVKAVPKKSSK